MAPEQARDSLTADARSDVYGLGCTLFAALTGDTPFPLRNPHDVVKAHQTQIPRSVREFVPDIPSEVADMVARMLAKRPDDRYPTAAAVAKALAPWCRPEPVDFDFTEILNERTQNALERVAELHKSRPIPSGSASSTTRLSKLSSVAQKSNGRSGDAGPTAGSGNDATKARHESHGQPVVIDRQVTVTGPASEPAEFRAPHRGKVLVPLEGGLPIPLVTNRILVGRSDECDLQIPDASVSGKHCELQFDGALWWITDAKSRNGTRVNGNPVTRRQIVDNDVISIGPTVRVRFENALAPNVQPAAVPRKSPSLVQIAIVVAAIVVAGAIGAAVLMQ
jgi:serine/threonine protein kinase